MDYSFDLISGNVHHISYQKDSADVWHHAYEYDADNRMTDVYTSYSNEITLANGEIATPIIIGQGPVHTWDREASYEYYSHGPLARVELGDLQVQGIDYVYTLQGWMKGVNSNTLDSLRDPGQDGNFDVSNINRYFPKDVYGYSLNYFTNDYNPIDNAVTGTDHFLADLTGSDILANRYDLFNGNIGSMVTTITNPTSREVLPLGSAYKYDQLNRILEARSFDNLNPSTNTFGSAGSEMYFNSFSYDDNGNILTQQRKDHTNNLFDNLTYRYAKNTGGRTIQNRLYHVDEDLGISSGLYTDDLEDQGTFSSTLSTINTANNYSFDEVGNLIKDTEEGIDEIKWRLDGKIAEIDMASAGSKPDLKFEYNSFGLRVAKHLFNQSNVLLSSEYFVHDATGNIIAVYSYTFDDVEELAQFKLTELDIYGYGKVGVLKPDLEMLGAIVDTSYFSRTLGKKNYFLSNHLSNIISTISDMKLPVESTITAGEVGSYRSDIIASNDFSLFGVELYDRKFNTSEVAYGLNGQRKDNEIYGEGNSYSAEFWQFDPRLGRRWNIDPVINDWESPYACFSNNPVFFADPKGDKVKVGKKEGEPTKPEEVKPEHETVLVDGNVMLKNTAKYDKYLTDLATYEKNSKAITKSNEKIDEIVATVNADLGAGVPKVQVNSDGELEFSGSFTKKQAKAAGAYAMSVYSAINSKETLTLNNNENTNLISPIAGGDGNYSLSIDSKQLNKITGSFGAGVRQSLLAGAFTSFNTKGTLDERKAAGQVVEVSILYTVFNMGYQTAAGKAATYFRADLVKRQIQGNTIYYMGIDKNQNRVYGTDRFVFDVEKSEGHRFELKNNEQGNQIIFKDK